MWWLTCALLAACTSMQDGGERPPGPVAGDDAGVGGGGPHDQADDGGPSPGDGPTVDGDAGSAAPCGTSFCRGQESCVAGACVFSCTGSRVPGDYATVQSAVDALLPFGGTICVGAGAWGAVSIRNGAMPLTIVGVSAAQSSLASLEILDNQAAATVRGFAVGGGIVARVGAAVTLDGIRASNPMGTDADPEPQAIVVEAQTNGSGGPFTLRGSQVINPAGVGLAVYHFGRALSVSIDGVELSANRALELRVYDAKPYYGGSATLSVRVTNNWIHDSPSGLRLTTSPMPTDYAGGVDVAFVNNTLTKNANAFDVSPQPGSPTGVQVTSFNNLFVGNQRAFAVMAPAALVANSHNALFDNVTNYDGVVVAGPGYVTSDPRLDASTAPPSLKPGSPAIGAGQLAGAPPADYWDRPRGATISLGALR